MTALDISIYRAERLRVAMLDEWLFLRVTLIKNPQAPPSLISKLQDRIEVISGFLKADEIREIQAHDQRLKEESPAVLTES